MKTVRLLPVVIFAALALLLFKGIGLVTNGSYVLTGSDAVLAAGAAGSGEPQAGMPAEAVLADTSPTLDDKAPTLATRADTGSSHGGTPSAPAASHEQSASGEHAEASAEASAVNCPTDASSADGGGTLTENIGNALSLGCAPVVTAAVNEHGDALPLVRDGSGAIVPLEASAGDNSEDALLARLGERRAELDRLEADISMRTALLEAAEQRLDERTKTLAALEARVTALVDEKQAAEEAGFKAVVSMYETMKPKEAAKIFDTLSTPVLLKVVRAMSPRKMSPILAAMSAEPAQKLTVALASTESLDVVADTGEKLAALPQIVGQ